MREVSLENLTLTEYTKDKRVGRKTVSYLPDNGLQNRQRKGDTKRQTMLRITKERKLWRTMIGDIM